MYSKINFRYRLIIRLPLISIVIFLAIFLISFFRLGAQNLKVSADHRHLVFAEGRPFFYLGDTAWEIFLLLNREEVDEYLKNRAAKGFTVIEAPVLPIFGRLQTPNRYGELPLINMDPLKPNLKYFDHVDYVINKAHELGLYFGLAPTWGDKVSMTKWSGSGPEIFTEENAKKYGAWIGRRYKGKKIIWVLGGDRNPETEEHLKIWRAMATGLEEGAGKNILITFHPEGGGNSATYFHNDSWLDFNMTQSGHSRKNFPNDSLITFNYNLKPVKPTLDGEPRYEDHPIGFDPAKGWFDDYDARQAAYWSLLAGACGHVYGNHNIWQFWTPGKAPISHARTPWREAMDQPGSYQMGFMRKLFETIKWQLLVPDLTLIDSKVGEKRQVAARASDGSCFLVYSPVGEPIEIRKLGELKNKSKAWWFDPRKGERIKIDLDQKETKFTPPSSGEKMDWVLVIERDSKKKL